MNTAMANRVRLGMTDLDVPPIALGTWQLGGEWGSFDEDEGIAAIRHARELGVNLFDTAHGYGFGASERVLGKPFATISTTAARRSWSRPRAAYG
jgi:aryl-alcohol dehydrogenase-like predicted oxidoreductase